MAVNARVRRAMESLAKSQTSGVYGKWAARLLKDRLAEEAEGEQWAPLLEENKHPWRLFCAEPSVLLGSREMRHLRKGENFLTVKSFNYFRWNGITMDPFKVRLDGLK